MIEIKNIYNLDLDNTITCGQIFRYEKESDGSYTIILSDRVINIRYDGSILYVNSNKLDNLEVIVKEYLDLKRDYISITNILKNNDPNLCESVDKSIGLKMIKQEPIECIISYIISQNNSVRNIANSLNLISKNHGNKVLFNNKEYYLFPTIDKLKNISLDQFREYKVGFRDKYLVGVIDSIVKKELDINKIYNMNTNDALRYLMTFKGIGMKVASCILLFSFQRFDTFPVDTWVKKYMENRYGIVGEDNIRKYALEHYNEYSGIAIQYMFNESRNKYLNFK